MSRSARPQRTGLKRLFQYRSAVRVHVGVAVSDRLAAIVIGTATGRSVWRLGRQTERLAHAIYRAAPATYAATM
jgi:hypothetical protein